MTTTYSYVLSTDFSGGIKETQLHTEIEDESTITSGTLVRIGVEYSDDQVNIVFNNALTGGEQTTLDGLVAAHIPDTSPPRQNFFTFDPKINVIKNTSYRKIGSFKYGGSSKIGTINYIDIIAYKEVKPSSYSLKVYDRTNSLTLAEKTGLTNTEEVIVDMGTINNIPENEAILEIQAKKQDNAGEIVVEQIIIYYNN